MNVFEIFAKLSLDSSQYDKEVEDAGKKAGKLGDLISGGLKTVGQVTGTVVKAAASKDEKKVMVEILQ